MYEPITFLHEARSRGSAAGGENCFFVVIQFSSAHLDGKEMEEKRRNGGQKPGLALGL